jgi:hypothetical protein
MQAQINIKPSPNGSLFHLVAPYYGWYRGGVERLPGAVSGGSL